MNCYCGNITIQGCKNYEAQMGQYCYDGKIYMLRNSSSSFWLNDYIHYKYFKNHLDIIQCLNSGIF